VWYLGGTLYDRIHEDSDTNLPETKIVEWLCQLCLALRYLHKKGVLHRDIKSQNIFLTGKDRIKIGDFGISKILGENRNYAKSFVGTPFYIAPEIILKMYNLY
jgi:NIMA (never in mitosis gene a)-related kinase